MLLKVLTSKLTGKIPLEKLRVDGRTILELGLKEIDKYDELG